MTKGYCIKDCFGNQLDNGLTAPENMKKLEEIIGEDTQNSVVITQPVRDPEDKYRFIFKFIDPDAGERPWDFLDEPGTA